MMRSGVVVFFWWGGKEVHIYLEVDQFLLKNGVNISLIHQGTI